MQREKKIAEQQKQTCLVDGSENGKIIDNQWCFEITGDESGLQRSLKNKPMI